jgi:hypothetical protein
MQACYPAKDCEAMLIEIDINPEEHNFISEYIIWLKVHTTLRDGFDDDDRMAITMVITGKTSLSLSSTKDDIYLYL